MIMTQLWGYKMIYTFSFNKIMASVGGNVTNWLSWTWSKLGYSVPPKCGQWANGANGDQKDPMDDSMAWTPKARAPLSLSTTFWASCSDGRSTKAVPQERFRRLSRGRVTFMASSWMSFTSWFTSCSVVFSANPDTVTVTPAASGVSCASWRVLCTFRKFRWRKESESALRFCNTSGCFLVATPIKLELKYVICPPKSKHQEKNCPILKILKPSFCRKLWSPGRSISTLAILGSKACSESGISSGRAGGSVSNGGVLGCATTGSSTTVTHAWDAWGAWGACCAWGAVDGSTRRRLEGGSRKPAPFQRSIRAAAFVRCPSSWSWFSMACTVARMSAFCKSAKVTGSFCSTIKQAKRTSALFLNHLDRISTPPFFTKLFMQCRGEVSKATKRPKRKLMASGGTLLMDSTSFTASSGLSIGFTSVTDLLLCIRMATSDRRPCTPWAPCAPTDAAVLALAAALGLGLAAFPEGLALASGFSEIQPCSNWPFWSRMRWCKPQRNLGWCRRFLHWPLELSLARQRSSGGTLTVAFVLASAAAASFSASFSWWKVAGDSSWFVNETVVRCFGITCRTKRVVFL